MQNTGLSFFFLQRKYCSATQVRAELTEETQSTQNSLMSYIVFNLLIEITQVWVHCFIIIRYSDEKKSSIHPSTVKQYTPKRLCAEMKWSSINILNEWFVNVNADSCKEAWIWKCLFCLHVAFIKQAIVWREHFGVDLPWEGGRGRSESRSLL